MIAFLLGVMMPIVFIVVHASLRLRNMKNKIIFLHQHLAARWTGWKSLPFGALTSFCFLNPGVFLLINKKGLRQCEKLQDLGGGDYYCCDCYGGEIKVKSHFVGFAQNPTFYASHKTKINPHQNLV